MHPTIFFDGECNLCNGAVQFIIARDRHALFRFAPLQSQSARDMLGASPGAGNTIVLLQDGRRYVRSDAAVRIGFALAPPWPVVAVVAGALPKPWRDAAYDWIARNRFRLFGKRAACMIPAPGVAARFLP